MLRFFLSFAVFAVSLAAINVSAQNPLTPSAPVDMPARASAPLPPTTNSPTVEEMKQQMDALGELRAQRALICEGFLTALKNGDKAAAKKFIAPSEKLKLDRDFALMHRLLKGAPPLTLQYSEQAPEDQIGPNDNLWTSGYSAPLGKRWMNAKLTLFNLRGAPAEIDGWEIIESDRPLQSQQMRDDAKVVLVFQFFGLNMLFAFCGGIILLLLLVIRSSRRSV